MILGHLQIEQQSFKLHYFFLQKHWMPRKQNTGFCVPLSPQKSLMKPTESMSTKDHFQITAGDGILCMVGIHTKQQSWSYRSQITSWIYSHSRACQKLLLLNCSSFPTLLLNAYSWQVSIMAIWKWYYLCQWASTHATILEHKFISVIGFWKRIKAISIWCLK